jgi:coatomer subunit beta
LSKMTAVEQPCYTLINVATDTEPYNEMQLKLDLEKGNVKQKVEALKKTIHMILAGERLPPGLLMTIIRYVLPLQDHTAKKTVVDLLGDRPEDQPRR